MATPERASLLGLPRELRDEICYHLLMWKLNMTFHKHGGLFERANFTPFESTPFSLPWVNLSLACKTIHLELRTYIEDSTKGVSDHAEDLRTYVMDLTFNK